MNEFNDYCKRLDRRRNDRLRRQKQRIMKEIDEVLAIMKKRKGCFDEENAEYIKCKIIPYLNKWKWLPDSYIDMLEDFKLGKSTKEV